MTVSTAGRMRRLARPARGIIAYGAAPALGLLSGPVLAQTLGPAGRGQFASVMEPLTVAGAVASIGIPAAVTYFSAQRGADAERIYRIGLLVAIVPSILVYAGMIWYSGEISRAQGLPRLVVVAAWAMILVSAVVQIRRGYWQGRAAWARLDLERFGFAVLRFAAVVVVALLGIHESSAFIGAALLAFVLAALLLWAPAPGRPRDRSHGVVVPRGGEFVGYSLTAAIGTISLVANNRLDQVLMPAQASSAQVGLYAVAVTVAEVPLVLAVLAARNALQLASAGQSLRAIVREVWIYVAMTAASSVVLAVFAGFYLPLFFGASFEPSVIAVQVLSIGTSIASFATVAGSIVSGRRRPALSSVIPLSGLVTTTVGFVALWGRVDSLTAAVIATLSQGVSVVAAAVVLAVVVRRPRRGTPAPDRAVATEVRG
ncbi:lipopolysaccharide biosynthesis protein [Mesorhizobium japonicum]|uniref:lipopolysaccharide biosynthesis protein n=1 Tax=Mesorhizobium japonicum TaxID=2066070 RepID=UPI003B5B03C4